MSKNIEETKNGITKFEEVKNQTTEEYFEKNQFSIDAFNSKYALYEGETYVQAIKRVCDFVASVEKTEQDQKYWSERWFDELYNDWWHPAGSIMQGAGCGKNVSLANCVTLSLGAKREYEEWDTLESIIRNTAYTVAKSAAYRQGLGVDFSRLRPRGTLVNNSARESTGAVHWMQFIDGIAYFVGQNGRRPAFLWSLSCKHPDIEEFVGVKKDYTKIQNANISVQITDDFYKAVEKDADWELRFEIPEIKKGDKIFIDDESATSECKKDKENGKWYKVAKKDRKKEVFTKTVKARHLLEKIARNMHANAEPGIQNIDIASKYSNSDVFYDPNNTEIDPRIISTNACSEQYLDRNGTCILSSINCEKFSVVEHVYSRELEKISKSINRFLDNVIECELKYETFTTPYQKKSMESLRRTGAGYTNICAWLFKAGLKYGDEEGNSAIENFTKWYCYWLYKSSEAIGKEKGDFGLFSSEKWKSAPFVKRLIKESQKLNKVNPCALPLTGENARNVTCISIAPTGSLVLMFRGLVLSYGIEPPFFMYFWKRTRITGKYEYYFCVPRVVREMFEQIGLHIPIESDTIKDTWDGKRGKPIAEFIDKHKEKFNFYESTDITAMDKLELMGKVMKWVDSSISVTYMLPEDSAWEHVYEFILEAHKKEVKSIAAFPDKKMYGIVSKISFYDLAKNLLDEGVMLHPQNFTDDELKRLNMSSEYITLKENVTQPERLPTLDAHIYTVTVKGEKFIMVVGIQNQQPFEIFGGHLNGLGIKSGYKEGKIHKIKDGKKKSVYALEFDDIYIEDFSKQFTPTEQILFRFMSSDLQKGIPIQDIVDVIQKATDDITSLAAAAARVLKKYIKNGTEYKRHACPECGGDLIYTDGCVSCSSCNWSKCS